MRTITKDELKEILKRHRKWQEGEDGGERADLSNADLCNADLRNANLYNTNLRNTKGLSPERTTPLLILAEQVGEIRAYKLTNENFESPMGFGKLTYTPGATLEVKDANTDPTFQCAKGISLCTLDWCLREWEDGWHIMVCEFSSKDIACIPTATDGKFRVHRCKVIREYDPSPIFEREKREREAWEAEHKGKA